MGSEMSQGMSAVFETCIEKETKLSPRYGMMTMYIKTMFHATVRESYVNLVRRWRNGSTSTDGTSSSELVFPAVEKSGTLTLTPSKEVTGALFSRHFQPHFEPKPRFERSG